jgi:hypothetical protein
MYTVEVYRNIEDFVLLKPYIKLENVRDVSESSVGGWCIARKEATYCLPKELVVKILKNTD